MDVNEELCGGAGLDARDRVIAKGDDVGDFRAVENPVLNLGDLVVICERDHDLSPLRFRIPCLSPLHQPRRCRLDLPDVHGMTFLIVVYL